MKLPETRIVMRTYSGGTIVYGAQRKTQSDIWLHIAVKHSEELEQQFEGDHFPDWILFSPIVEDAETAIDAFLKRKQKIQYSEQTFEYPLKESK